MKQVFCNYFKNRLPYASFSLLWRELQTVCLNIRVIKSVDIFTVQCLQSWSVTSKFNANLFTLSSFYKITWNPQNVWVDSRKSFNKGLQYYNFVCKRFIKRKYMTLRVCSMYLKGSSILVLCLSEKHVTARHVNQIILKECGKSWDFAKMKLKFT